MPKKRPGGIVLRMTDMERMHSPGINGEGELRGQPGSPEKMAVKTECVCVCVFEISGK